MLLSSTVCLDIMVLMVISVLVIPSLYCVVRPRVFSLKTRRISILSYPPPQWASIGFLLIGFLLYAGDGGRRSFPFYLNLGVASFDSHTPSVLPDLLSYPDGKAYE